MQKFSVKCPKCKQIIPYEDYAFWLRLVPFFGVWCPVCDTEWDLDYQEICGTGRTIKTKYLYPGEMKASRVQFYASCPYCYSFWESSGDNTCPFCHAFISSLCSSATSYIKSSSNIPKDLGKKLREVQLKIDFLDKFL